MAEPPGRGREPRTLGAAVFFWLTLALGLATLPHLGHMPWWLGGWFAAAAVWRWSAEAHGLYLPGRWLLLTLTLSIGAGVLLSYGTLLGRDAGVALLSAMTSLKLLESRALRDLMVLAFMGYLLIMANLLYTQSLPAAAYLLLTLWLLLAAHLRIQHGYVAMPRWAPLRLGAGMLCQSVPVMLILFVLFPRISGPLWSLPKDVHSGLTGLSDEMAPGSLSRLSRSDAVAFRVRFAGPVPPPGQLYWRGPVLWFYDGQTWKGRGEKPSSFFPYTAEGAALDYTVFLEPHGKRWLFALDLPASLPAHSGLTGSFQVLRSKPVIELLRYEMRSYPHYRTAGLSGWERRRALQLPPWANPRARALADAWRRRNADPHALVRAALRLFREAPFHYTLTPPALGAAGVDEFLFRTRRGFCEHYAGSFVFLMRASGVPARVVTGYQGGERNALGDYLIVRQSDAHAWAEVWLEGRGWVRVDPTAVVAPQRVEQGLYAAVADPQVLPFLARRDSLWIRRLALGWDSLNNAWNEWVLAYGAERQRRLLSGLGFDSLDWRWTTLTLIAALGAGTLAFAGLRAWRDRVRVDPVLAVYRRYCATLARRGLVRGSHEGPLDFAERVAAVRPDLAFEARRIARFYADLRYGQSAGRAQAVQRLRRLVRDFKA